MRVLPRPTPRLRAVEAFAVVILVAVVVAAVVALNALVIMLLWGAIAGAIDAPTIGYGTAALVALAVALIFGNAGRAAR